MIAYLYGWHMVVLYSVRRIKEKVIQWEILCNHMSPTDVEALNRSDSWRDVWLSWTGDQLLIDGTVRTVTLVRIVHFFSTDIEMEVGMKKCGIITIKRGKVVRCEGI